MSSENFWLWPLPSWPPCAPNDEAVYADKPKNQSCLRRKKLSTALPSSYPEAGEAANTFLPDFLTASTAGTKSPSADRRYATSYCPLCAIVTMSNGDGNIDSLLGVLRDRHFAQGFKFDEN